MNDTIVKIQKIQLDILKEIDLICRRNKLNYQLFGGTLLGAVRHGGFIPWDDDIDISMPRDDYEKFIELCSTELPNDYFLQTFKTDKKTIFPFAKIRKNNTLFIQDGNKVIKMHHGIFIDVFPLDKYFPNNFRTKINNVRINFLSNIMKKSHERFVYNKKKRFLQPIKWLLGVFKIIPSSWFIRRINTLAKKNKNKNAEFFNHLTNGTSKKRVNRFLMTKKDLVTQTHVLFEGIEFPITKNYDEVLTRCYGNYMKLPREEDRVGHHAKYIAFDKKTLYIYNGKEYVEANDDMSNKYLKLIR